MKYRANPVIVDAFRINKVIEGSTESPMVLALENGKLVSPNAGMTARMNPQVGDYWVVQSDGYVYLNPKDVFEKKYSLVEGPKKRPTIAELDKILNSEEDTNITVNPDGSISAI